MRFIAAYVIRILESIHFTFFTTFCIFLVKYRQERHNHRQGCFYYVSTDRVALASITNEQLFSPLKSTVPERDRERERGREALSRSERERETLTVLIINRAHAL